MSNLFYNFIFSLRSISKYCLKTVCSSLILESTYKKVQLIHSIEYSAFFLVGKAESLNIGM